MIGFHELDMMVRGGSLGLLALFAWLLWRDHRKAFAARVGLVMLAAIAAHVVASTPGGGWQHNPVRIVLDLASSSVFGLFWLFTRAWFEDTPRFGWRSWAIALSPTLMIAALVLVGHVETPSVRHVWFPLSRLAWFAFGIGGLWVAWRGRDEDLVESRRRLRLGLVASVGGLALLVNCVEIAVFGYGAPVELRSLTQFGIVLATFLVCTAMFRVREDDLFGPIAQPSRRTSPEPTDADGIALRLLAHMETEKPYRSEVLTIAGLASQLGEPEYRLRRVINGTLGHRNFAGFLNEYRLGEVKAALADPTQREVPILTIALDAGFGSLGPFNRAFRQSEGVNPSKFRRAAM